MARCIQAVLLGAIALWAMPLCAQTVTASVNVNSVLATVPAYGMGMHTSVYDNSLWYIDNPGSSSDDHFDLLPGRLADAGVNVLRYPGGGYADAFHFSLARPSWESGITGSGMSPAWGQAGNYGYVAPKTDFGNFIRLLDAMNSKTIITVNTGSAIKYDNPNQLGVPTHNGQAKEAAAWVAYANGNASLYGTPSDIPLGVDAEGNNWKTVGYWAKLRASTPAEYSSWATAGGVYDSRNAFLAIDRDAPVGIKYWEVGNESFGTGYYGGKVDETGYALNYAAPYDGTARDDNPLLSPAAYGQQVNEFTAAMKAVDPSIKVGAVLATPRTSAFVSWNTIGDYIWSYADLNDDGVKQANEPYWNDEVLSHTDGSLGKVADNIDFVISHWYPTPDNGASGIVHEPRLTIPVMINGTTAGQDSGSNAGLRDSIAAWRSDHNPKGLEIFITETDGYGGSDQAADGLFAADAYVTFFDHGVSNVDWLEIHNGESFLTSNANDPNFAYWGIQSVHKLAQAGDELVATATTENDVRIHAARKSDGSVAVMILNMNTTSRTVNVAINGSSLAENGVRYQTNGDSALSSLNFNDLGNSFSTSVAARTLQVFVIAGVPGDFNRDGIVDAADYVVWRRAQGTTLQLPNDGGIGGTVGAAHYNLWRAGFGNSGVGAAASWPFGDLDVPEPASSMPAAIAVLWLAMWRLR